MNPSPLDESYLEWLYSQVGNPKTKTASRSYWSLLRQLYTKEFVWFVPNDDNRAEDGRDLRYAFENEMHIVCDQEWLDLGCSMLELLIGIAQRLEFATEVRARAWFWHLIHNLGLHDHTDAHYRSAGVEEEVDARLDKVIWREYRADGHGGLFPLRRRRPNQTGVELWYQMSAYILEREEG